MKVSEKDVTYVAELANLDLTDAERPRLVRDLNQVLEHIDRLNELDTTHVEPMAEVADLMSTDGGQSTPFGYAMRDDEVRPSLDHEVAMSNASESDGTFFKVPRVIENSEK